MQPHIMCKSGDVGEYVLLPGDPKRTRMIAELMEEPRIVADYRQFITYTGWYKGVRVSTTSTGIGCPAAAITVEELSRVGAKCFIRVGTTGSIQPYIDTGDIVVATGAVRDEGTTVNYAPRSYPALASLRVVDALLEASKKVGVDCYSGIVWTSDAFYSEDMEKVELYRKIGVLSVEMECSAIFTLASIKGLLSGAILAVDGNLIKGTKKSEFKPHEKKGEFDPIVRNAVLKEVKIALEAIRILHEEGLPDSPAQA